MSNKPLLLVLLTCTLLGCGFHLRGPMELPTAIKETRIEGIAEFSPLGVELKKIL